MAIRKTWWFRFSRVFGRMGFYSYKHLWRRPQKCFSRRPLQTFLQWSNTIRIKDFFIFCFKVSKTYHNLTKHGSIKITANIHFFDDWQGETIYLKINNQIIWQKSARASKNKNSINICGNDQSDPIFASSILIINFTLKLMFLYSSLHVDFPHSEESLKITFGSNLKRPACQASFGVDDVMIYTIWYLFWNQKIII